MKNWKQVNKGQTVLFSWDDFDGQGTMVGVVTEKHKEYCIVKVGSIQLWLDEDTKYHFHVFKQL